MAYDLKNILELRTGGGPLWNILFSCKAVGGPWSEKYIEAEEQGAAHCEILYFSVKEVAAHDLKNILNLKSRGRPTAEYYIFVESRGWPMI